MSRRCSQPFLLGLPVGGFFPEEAGEDQAAYLEHFTELRNYWDNGEDRTGLPRTQGAVGEGDLSGDVTAVFVEESSRGPIDAARTMAQGGALTQRDASAIVLGREKDVMAITICGAREGGEAARKGALPLARALAEPWGRETTAQHSETSGVCGS